MMNLNNPVAGGSALGQYPYIAAVPVTASNGYGNGTRNAAAANNAAIANNGQQNNIQNPLGPGAPGIPIKDSPDDPQGKHAKPRAKGRPGRKRKSKALSGPTDDPDLNARLLMKCTCRKKDPHRIPRPRNAFILFRQKHHQEILEDGGKIRTNPEVSKELGRRWRNLPQEEKAYWVKQAEEEKRRHALKYPNYKYTPKRNSKKKCPHCLAKAELKALRNAKRHGAPTGPHGLLLTGKHNGLVGANGVAGVAGNPAANGVAAGITPGISYGQYGQQPFAFTLAGANQFYTDLGQNGQQQAQQQAQQQFQRLQSPQQVQQGSPQQGAGNNGAPPVYYQQGLLGLQQVVLLPQQAAARQAAAAAAAGNGQGGNQRQGNTGNQGNQATNQGDQGNQQQPQQQQQQQQQQQVFKPEDLYPMAGGNGGRQQNNGQNHQANGQNGAQNQQGLNFSPGSTSVSKSPSLSQQVQQGVEPNGYQGLFGQSQAGMRYGNNGGAGQNASAQTLQQMYMQLDGSGANQQGNQQNQGGQAQQQAQQNQGNQQGFNYLHGYDFQQLQQSNSQQSQVPLPPINNISLPPLNMNQKGN